MSLIRLREVSKRFDGRQVLRKVFFRLEESDRVGLIGNNGSGKTTVLRMILGQEEPSQGQIDVDDGLRMGYFSQFSELSGEMSIEEVLEELFAHIKTTRGACPWRREPSPRRPGRGKRPAWTGRAPGR